MELEHCLSCGEASLEHLYNGIYECNTCGLSYDEEVVEEFYDLDTFD